MKNNTCGVYNAQTGMIVKIRRTVWSWILVLIIHFIIIHSPLWTAWVYSKVQFEKNTVLRNNNIDSNKKIIGKIFQITSCKWKQSLCKLVL